MKYLKVYEAFGGTSYINELMDLIDMGFIILYSSDNHTYIVRDSVDNFYTTVEISVRREDYKSIGLNAKSYIFDDIVEIIVESVQRVLFSREFTSSEVSIKNIGRFDGLSDGIKYKTLIEINFLK